MLQRECDVVQLCVTVMTALACPRVDAIAQRVQHALMSIDVVKEALSRKKKYRIYYEQCMNYGHMFTGKTRRMTEISVDNAKVYQQF